jgi:hypothetical protein
MYLAQRSRLHPHDRLKHLRVTVVSIWCSNRGQAAALFRMARPSFSPSVPLRRRGIASVRCPSSEWMDETNVPCSLIGTFQVKSTSKPAIKGGYHSLFPPCNFVQERIVHLDLTTGEELADSGWTPTTPPNDSLYFFNSPNIVDRKTAVVIGSFSLIPEGTVINRFTQQVRINIGNCDGVTTHTFTSDPFALRKVKRNGTIVMESDE